MRRLILVMILIAIFGGVSVQAAGVVGTGTAASCTEAAFDAAFAGGGVITFNCGSAPVTIFLSGSKTVRATTVIQGGGLITFDGGGYTQMFYVMPGVEFTLQALTVQNGRSIDGGAIKNDGGILHAGNVVFRNNESVEPEPTSLSGNGGAIYNNGGTLDIYDSTFRSNFAANWGGAIFTAGGRVTLNRVVFLGNRVIVGGNDGGAIASGSGSFGGLPGSAIDLTESRFGLNQAPLSGGAIFTSNGGTLNSFFTNYVWNLANVGAGIADAGSESVTIMNARFLTNVARYYGGAINASAALLVMNSELTGNSARGGGAIQYSGAASGYISDTTFARNRATSQDGGAILNTSGDLRILNSLFSTNIARGNGGAIYNDQTTSSGFNLRVANTTFSRNRANGAGGGIYHADSSLNVWLRFVTMAYNAAPTGASLYGTGYRIVASIIAYPATGANCSAAIADVSWLIQSGDTSCNSATAARDPLLMPLANNGGATYTHALSAGSPAIDTTICPPLAEGLDIDQRHFTRPAGADCDIGAYEFGASGTESAVMPLTAATLPQVPTVTPIPATRVQVDCQLFRLSSPREGLPNGVVTVYWDAAPGATGYRVAVYNESNTLVTSQDAPAGTTSLIIDVSQAAIGGGFTFTIEVQALLNNQAVCRSAATMLRASPNVSTPVPQCGNGIQEPGESANTCPNGV